MLSSLWSFQSCFRYFHQRPFIPNTCCRQQFCCILPNFYCFSTNRVFQKECSLLPSACFLHLFDQHLSVNVSCVISLWVFIISIDFYALKYFEANFVVFSHYWYFFQYFQAGIHSCRWLSTTILHQSKQWICKRNRNKTFWKGKCVTNNEFANTNWLIEKKKKTVVCIFQPNRYPNLAIKNPWPLGGTHNTPGVFGGLSWGWGWLNTHSHN